MRLLSEQEEFAIGSKDTLEGDAQHFLQKFQIASGAEAPGNTEASIIIYGPLLIICKEVIHLGFLQAKPKEASGSHQKGKTPKGIQVGHCELDDLCGRCIGGIPGYVGSQMKTVLSFIRANQQYLLIFLTVLDFYKYRRLQWLF